MSHTLYDVASERAEREIDYFAVRLNSRILSKTMTTSLKNNKKIKTIFCGFMRRVGLMNKVVCIFKLESRSRAHL